MSSTALNLERIVQAINEHNAACSSPANAVLMCPFECERLGFDTILGLPIIADETISTGRVRIQCADPTSGEGLVEAVSEQRKVAA